MKKYVVVFRSRTDVLTFIDDMRKLNAYAKVISTPKQAKIGCGISAEIWAVGLSTAKKLIKIKKYNSFHAILLISNGLVKIIWIKKIALSRLNVLK